MYRCSRNLHAVIQGSPVDTQSVEALAAEGRDQGRMNVDDPFRIRFCKAFRQNGQKARQHDQIHPVFPEQRHEPVLKRFLAAAVLFGHGHAGNPGCRRPFQRVDPGLVGDHKNDLPALQRAAPLGIDQCLQIRTAAGDKHRDSGLHSRITFSSFRMISPIT